ncbi:DUF6517 family protein [Natronomonas sp. EA1]|uniref:DUF6517 family protein n=1 Tax=Natronomonas sp. EA1 TaxID=3421655 RepID=UPI003EB91181
MQTRRRFLAATGLAGISSLAGCLGFLTGTEPLTFAASPVSVSPDARSGTGYREVRVGPQTTTQTVTVAGQTREVEVTNHAAQYDRELNLAVTSTRFASFVAFSTPRLSVAGQSLNPLAELSNEEIANMVAEQANVQDLSRTGERSVPMLGTTATVVTYEGTATLGGVQAEVRVHLTDPVEAGDDLVLGLAVHPRQVDERARVDRLLSGVTHAPESS